MRMESCLQGAAASMKVRDTTIIGHFLGKKGNLKAILDNGIKPYIVINKMIRDDFNISLFHSLHGLRYCLRIIVCSWV